MNALSCSQFSNNCMTFLLFLTINNTVIVKRLIFKGRIFESQNVASCWKNKQTSQISLTRIQVLTIGSYLTFSVLIMYWACLRELTPGHLHCVFPRQLSVHKIYILTSFMSSERLPSLVAFSELNISSFYSHTLIFFKQYL